jgi:hypothetical protein
VSPIVVYLDPLPTPHPNCIPCIITLEDMPIELTLF